MRTNAMRQFHSHIEGQRPYGNFMRAYERSEVSSIRKFSAYKIFWIYSTVKEEIFVENLIS